jgi:CTP:molybdopterin cytidylyltransferase MocA
VLHGIVLAAGDSSRMGSPKALLPAPDGQPFVVRIVRTLAEAGVTDLVIVTGRHHDDVVRALGAATLPVVPQIARNPDPSRGPLSSIWAGMDAVVDGGSGGILMTLVDVPMVSASTVASVVAAWRRTRAPIVRPAIGDRHGHPVIFDRVLFAALRAAPIEAGAKSVVRAHARDILNVQVDDEGCLVDVDTPEEYRDLRGSDGGSTSSAS